MFNNKLNKEMTKLLLNQEILMQQLDDLEKEANKRGILLNQLKDQVENALLSQKQKSESKGIFSLKMRK
jgi:hypothetical protein|tara:strand:+ start:527 stop:733 length:207 start_codon:yes stop_codon:yes gene_type:complete